MSIHMDKRPYESIISLQTILSQLQTRTVFPVFLIYKSFSIYKKIDNSLVASSFYKFYSFMISLIIRKDIHVQSIFLNFIS